MAKRFDQARPFTTLAIVAVVWLVAPVAIKHFVRASFFEFTAPITLAEARITELQDYWHLRTHSQRELISAGVDLARVNASYALSVQQNAALQNDVARLQQMLRMPAPPHFRLEPARVARRDFSAWWQRLTIAKGRNYGITVGSPVVYADGVVGRVSEVQAMTATVDLISSQSVRLAAFFEGETRPVSYQGGINPNFGPAKGIVEFVPLDISLAPGETKRLQTSGLGGEFPAGLTLGRVTHLQPSGDGLFQTGVVSLNPNLDELLEVTVLCATD
ncbi:MAG TPA: rod shape-determining protein MreC [Opitutaceae bacterium]